MTRIDDDTATAHMEVIAAHGATLEVRVRLVRHHGLWFVAEVPVP